jgi:oxygen-independent coproporphyrinogen-3 oxidase
MPSAFSGAKELSLIDVHSGGQEMLLLKSDTANVPGTHDHDKERMFLRERMQKPQRHRLLHGYPLAAAMHSRNVDSHEELLFDPRTDRGLLVGVLPHPFCNPAVTGCGFCTFPHETYNATRSAVVVEHVIQEIEQRLRLDPGLQRRRVTGLYFGGGTANLTPPESFRQLCQALHSAFDLSRAEVTLEGVPAYFIKRRALLDILREELPARHYRISMGIQTFDTTQLQRMGRLAFGTRTTFHDVVQLGHRLGFTVSADLLFNLPGQTLEQMQGDLEQAMKIGLDHLGLYHLVLFAGLGTAWSRQPEMLAGLPSNKEACDRWLVLREKLLTIGFYQTTLTNFEREEFRSSKCRFQYEESSFLPDRFEMLGFGPSGISCVASAAFVTGLKTLNCATADGYINAVRSRVTPWDRFFRYKPRDLRIFYLTRRLAALEINRDDYQRLFGVDPLIDFGREFLALENEGLIETTATTIHPTPRGMFYADSIAALLAWRQIQQSRSSVQARGEEASTEGVNSNGHGHM